jgi:hypothetical protein
MTKDKPIFGLRFGSNEKLLPSQEDLRAFLAATYKEGTKKPHADDLAEYDKLVRGMQDFERRQAQDPGRLDFREKLFYGVLGRTYFIGHGLKAAVGEFIYHLHALRGFDFKKPTAFIRSAEEELSKLNPKKKEDAAKHARLTAMAEERKKTIEELKKRWAVLTAELGDIARYVQDNLARVEKICEASIVVLVDDQLRRKKEEELLESVKTRFKDKLRDTLHQGAITKELMEAAKQDMVVLSKEISALIRDDVYAVTGLFEAVHDHAKKASGEISGLLSSIESVQNVNFEEELVLYSRIEGLLISLVSEYHLTVKTTELRSETAHEDILLDVRREMLDHIVGLLDRERRTSAERRSGEDRRKFNDPNRKGVERRGGHDRRSGKGRRD